MSKGKIKPYDWQEEKMVDPLYGIFQQRKSAILTACCGAGKTIAALALAKRMGQMAFVVAPKISLPSWRETAEAMDVELLDAVNIEMLRTGNTKYLTRIGKRFIWNLDPEQVFWIGDEAHQLCGYDTLNAEVAGAVAQHVSRNGVVEFYQLNSLFMSATLGESPIKFGGPMGKVLGFHSGANYAGYRWMMRNGCFKDAYNNPRFPTGESRLPWLKKLHDHLYPSMGVNLKHADIPGFPENQIITELVTIKPKELKELQAVYDKYEELDQFERTRDALANKDENALTIQLRARQMSEIAKIPHILELTNNLIEEGGSIVIFLSFRETLDVLKQKLKKHNPAIIRGGQVLTKKYDERKNEMDAFLADKTRVCLCAIQAGGVSIDLNDQHGTYPRYTIMSPPQTAEHFVQAVGRVWRTNSMSPSIQYLLLAQGTVEEKIAKNLQVKLTNLEAVNDRDFWT